MYGKDRVQLEEVLIHEMCHVFLHLFHKDVILSSWLHEGFAQYFEFLHNPADPKVKLWKRLMKAMVREKSTRPFPDFWVLPISADDMEGYAQAWSLVSFLAQNADLRKKTGKFVIQLKEAAPSDAGYAIELPTEPGQQAIRNALRKVYSLQADVFKDVYGKSPEEFEAAWKRYVLTTY